jgi:hypothetical protein
MASLQFSATDSTTARAIPASSSCAGSRPQRFGSSPRAPCRSPASSACWIRSASTVSDLAPVTAQVTVPAQASRATGRCRKSRAAASAGAIASASQQAVKAAPDVFLSVYRRRSMRVAA